MNILFNYKPYNEKPLLILVIIRIKNKKYVFKLTTIDLIFSKVYVTNIQRSFSVNSRNWLPTALSFVTICSKTLRRFLLYSSPLGGIRNTPSPLFLFLDFEQPSIEQFDPAMFKTKNLQVHIIPLSDLCTFYPFWRGIGSSSTLFSMSAWNSEVYGSF